MSAWLFAVKDLQRLRRDPAGILLWMGIPLVIGAMVSLASGGGSGQKPVAKVLVAAAEPDSLWTRLITGALDGSELIRTEMVEIEDGRQRVSKGDASALLVVPEGFALDVLRDRPTQLELLTNPAQRVLPGLVEGVLRTFVDGAFYVQKLIGPELREIADGPPPGASTLSDIRVAALGMRFNRLADRLVERLDPLPIRLVDASPKPAADRAAPRGFGAMFWPGILLMALFFVAQGLGQDLWEERRLGTLRRALMTPAGIRPWLHGKLLCAAIVTAAVGVVGLGVGALLFGTPWHALPLGVPWVALTGVVLLLLLWPLICVATSARGANVLSSACMFPLLMLGGSFFPFEAMPAWMQDLGGWTPNGWLLLRLRALVDGRAEPLQLLLGLGLTALLFAVVVPFCARRLRGAFTG